MSSCLGRGGGLYRLWEGRPRPSRPDTLLARGYCTAERVERQLLYVSVGVWICVATDCSVFQIVVEWYLDSYVTRIAIRDRSRRRRPTIADFASAGNTADDTIILGDDIASVFLVPMNGGIWTLCVSLTGMCGGEERLSLSLESPL